jgi:hypothetical protein
MCFVTKICAVNNVKDINRFAVYYCSKIKKKKACLLYLVQALPSRDKALLFVIDVSGLP